MRRLAGREFEKVITAGLYEAADVVKAEAQRLITTSSVSGKSHVPSAPGEPPQNDIGNLSRKIITTRTKKRLTAEIRSEAAYAAALERGTSKMAARPYMRPARDAKRKEVRAIVEKKLGSFIRKSRP